MSFDFQSLVQQFGVGGLTVNKGRDLVEGNKLSTAKNVRIYKHGEIRPRRGLGGKLFTAALGDPIRSVARYNDPLGGEVGYIVGAGSKAYWGQEGGTLAEVLSGLGGDALQVGFVRPSQGAKAWAYVANRLLMGKVSPEGVGYNWSIEAGNVPVKVTALEAVYKVIDLFDAVGSWVNGGTAGALAGGARVSLTLAAGELLWDEGTSGWACIAAAGMDENISAGAMLSYNNGGGAEEYARVFGVSQASGTTVIAAIKYDSGSTGKATVLLETSTANLEINSVLKFTTGATVENVRVIEVVGSGVGKPTVIVSTVGTHTVGATVDGVRSYRTYLKNTHIAGEMIETDYVTSAISVGTGTFSLVSALDLSQAEGTSKLAFKDNDEVHISIRIDNPANLTEIKVKLDIDSAVNDFTKNYFYYAIQPSAFSASGTTLTAAQVDLQRQAIIGYQVPQDYNQNNYNNYDQYNGGYGGYGGSIYAGAQDYSLTSPQGAYTEPIYGAVSNSSAVSDAATGASQWTELSIKLSDFKRIGSDLSRGWKDVQALCVSVEALGTVNVALDSWYVAGGYNVGETVSGIAQEYNWVAVGRNRNTGDRSLPTPALRSGITLRRNSVLLSIDEFSDPQVTDYDWYRIGGTLVEWINIGSSPASGTGTVTFVDNYSDDVIAANAKMSREDYPVFPMLDAPKSGTATIQGNRLVKLTGDNFNIQWAAGVRILIRDANDETYLTGLYARPYSTTLLELQESPGFNGTVDWSISEPVLLGQPVRSLWGPYNAADLGKIMLACGSQYQAGTLYFTNPDRPGSASLRNQLEVTSPQEPLMAGFMYDSQAFVFSTDRMFRIFPNGDGTLVPQEVANSKGLAAENCIAVGQVVFFLGKDGIYATTGGQPISITDKDLYPIFPHDTQPGEISNEVYPPDYTQAEKFNFSYHNDHLYFTYITSDNDYYTLVYDVSMLVAGLSDNMDSAGGWVSMDVYNPAVTCTSSEQGVDSDPRLLFGAEDGNIYEIDSDLDVLTPIDYVIETKSHQLNRPDLLKHIAAFQLMADIKGGTAVFKTRTDLSTSLVSQATKTLAAGRRLIDIPVSATGTAPFDGYSARYVGLRIEGSTEIGVRPIFYQAFLNYALLPTDLETSIWSPPVSDNGLLGWQHLLDCFLTVKSNEYLTFTVYADEQPAVTYTVPSTGGKFEKVYINLDTIKGKLFRYELSSPTSTPFQIRPILTELHAKRWGSPESYVTIRPFGQAAIGQ